MDALAEQAETERATFARAFAFVWRHWRQRLLMLGCIVTGVFVGVLLEVQVPARAADLVGALRTDAGADALLTFPPKRSHVE